ncbi:beta-1,3-galactosyl-O-glycosyl-glycoprotein beta-1,6-N-acetylglucosaminyltransferase 3-like [Littorina saxatilis]
MQEMNDTSAARRPPGFYGTITDNCQLYRKQNGFILNVSQEEREFPLAFSMMVYKEPEQLERLLRAVYRPHNAYCVHADLKTKPDVLQQIRAIIKCLPNVIESPRQIDVKWGKFSVLEPELICMQALWRMRSKWKYLINLTGQEFPLKTNKELVKILTAYKGANDILGERPKERNKWRWQKAKSPPPHNITVAKGPVHVAASRGFVDFLLHYSYARDFLAWTKRTAIPDETFFATLNNMHQFGVPGSYTGNITSKRRIMLNRFKIWDTSNRTCSGKFLRNICHFGLAEVADLSRSRHFVANKFSYDFYPLAYDCTEQWYFDRVRREEKTGVADIDTRYYSNLELVKHAYRGSAGNGP